MKRGSIILAVLFSILALAGPQLVLAQPASSLSDEEAAGLMYMREEEKLAHDIYLAFNSRWQTAIFARIATSEAQHMDAIKLLLDRYGLPDPAAGHATGEFTNTELQALYNDLIVRGDASLAEALRVGGLIEEVDIADLAQRSAITDNADIAQVYASLSCGSRNHLRAFASWYETTSGTAYIAQHLSADEVATIRANAHERCGQGANTPRRPGGPRRP